MSGTIEIELARECLYRLLAVAVSDPHDPAWPDRLPDDIDNLAGAAAALIREEASVALGPLARGELAPDALQVDSLVAAIRGPAEEVRREHSRVFGFTPPRECPPFETDFHANAEPFFHSQQMADVAGFYRAFGLNPPPGRPDHIVLELEFMAFLQMKKRLLRDDTESPNIADALEVCAKAEIDFFRDHLTWWLPAFATGLQKRAGHGYYADLGRALAAFVAAERRLLGVSVPRISLGTVAVERPEEAMECAACSA